MKRIIRSLMLAGAMVFLILLYSPQPAQADNPPSASDTPAYEGHITFEQKYHMSAQGVSDNINWLTRGTLLIYFDGKVSGLNKISPVFATSYISQKIVQPANEACSAIYYRIGAIADLSAERSTDFDTKEPSFTFPIKFGKAKILTFQLTGDCPGMRGEEGYGTYTGNPEIDGYATIMKKVKLYIYHISKTSLGGSCSVINWEESTRDPMFFGEDCHWSAFRLPAKSPGDENPKLVPLAPLVPGWKGLK